MPDTSVLPEVELTYSKRLSAMSENFVRRERAVGRAYALSELMQDAEQLIQVALDERAKLRGL